MSGLCLSKQTSSNRNDVSENCHQLEMSCQSLCWANDYFWVLWELKVSNSGSFFYPQFVLWSHSSMWGCWILNNLSGVVVCEPSEPVLQWRTKLITKASEILWTWAININNKWCGTIALSQKSHLFISFLTRVIFTGNIVISYEGLCSCTTHDFNTEKWSLHSWFLHVVK